MERELFIFLTFFVLSVFALDSCGRNTMSTPCGNSCQPTCGELTPKYCSKSCKLNSCVCKPGYIRRDENGPCILEHWCKIAAEKMDWSRKLYFNDS